jgi:hypothetical protein
MAYGLGVAFSDRSSPGTLFNVYLFDDNGELASASDLELQESDLNGAGGSYYRPVIFDAPVELDPGMDYRVFVENALEERIAVGLSGIVTPGGLLGHVIDDTQNTIYIGFGNPALMVRMYLSEAVGVAETAAGSSVLGIRPNPADDACVVRFRLTEGATVRCTISDVNGRTIQVEDLGRRAAGVNEMTLDTGGLPAGAYQITLSDGGIRAHGKLVVVH